MGGRNWYAFFRSNMHFCLKIILLCKSLCGEKNTPSRAVTYAYFKMQRQDSIMVKHSQELIKATVWNLFAAGCSCFFPPLSLSSTASCFILCEGSLRWKLFPTWVCIYISPNNQHAPIPRLLIPATSVSLLHLHTLPLAASLHFCTSSLFLHLSSASFSVLLLTGPKPVLPEAVGVCFLYVFGDQLIRSASRTVRTET